LQSLDAEHPEDAVLYVPASYLPQSPAPLAVLFHGAGGGVSGVINAFQGRAEADGIILLATKSRDASWDITVTGEFGADIAFLDDALADVFSRFAVDPSRVALAGFSDGASYALAVGLANGSLVTNIIAFSPGFLAFSDVEGEPRIFISHGTQDIVLPIDQTSRKIVPQLRQAGYEVEYVEFDGLHMVPDDVLDAAVDWWLH
jgi:predicted esterase